MPDTETLDLSLSGINPDLQLPLNSGKLTHCCPSAQRSEEFHLRVALVRLRQAGFHLELREQPE